ncbi:hypothetical protein JXB41_03165 [Candidatus Woesearchaeota archaeon]|nr:hypothetical protein [Candidatus Woesearchaeota archaeon]
MIFFSISIIKVNLFDYKTTYFDIKNDLENIMVINESIIITKNSVNFNNYNSAGSNNQGLQEIDYDNKGLVYVFGAASVVAPTYNASFPYYLEEYMNKNNRNIKIVNLGMEGIYSDIIKTRIASSLNNNILPELIIPYCGHNDYDRIYWAYVKGKMNIISKLFPNDLIEKLEKRNMEQRFNQMQTDNEKLAPKYVPVFSNIDGIIEPNIKKYLQMIGILRLNQEYFNSYNRLILDHYSKNIVAIIRSAKEKKIPRLIVTPISNLEAEPFGINKATLHLYRQGLKENDYNRRIKYLTDAKDSEIFSYQLRAKSDLSLFLNSINESRVYVLDLKKELMNDKFNFSYDNFYDYVHLRPAAHKKISLILGSYILERKII